MKIHYTWWATALLKIQKQKWDGRMARVHLGMLRIGFLSVLEWILLQSTSKGLYNRQSQRKSWMRQRESNYIYGMNPNWTKRDEIWKLSCVRTVKEFVQVHSSFLHLSYQAQCTHWTFIAQLSKICSSGKIPSLLIRVFVNWDWVCIVLFQQCKVLQSMEL
jgi:hypothetical protein